VIVLGFDTATPATAVALLRDGEPAGELRHDPAAGERPGHAAQLLELVRRVLAGAGTAWGEVDRIAVGEGPGTFTGLRIGVATARALAQATGAELVPVSTLAALAEPVAAPAVLAVLDARRGEAFASGWAGGREVAAPAALAPEALGALRPPGASPWTAVGDGAVRFRPVLEGAGSTVPPDGDPVHRVSAAALCRLAAAVPHGSPPGAVVPRYLRLPDAEIAHRRSHG
jgi:tRNA threonylcarbamoyladenosine biosynthesis protein TsaB